MNCPIGTTNSPGIGECVQECTIWNETACVVGSETCAVGSLSYWGRDLCYNQHIWFNMKRMRRTGFQFEICRTGINFLHMQLTVEVDIISQV